MRRGLSRRAVAAAPRVLYVADGRDRAALDGYFDALGKAGCAQIEMVAMDVWASAIETR